MAEFVLNAAKATDGLDLPLSAGAARLLAAQPEALVSVAPFAGKAEAVAAALKKQVGTGLTASGRYADGEEGRVIWAGYRQWFVASHDQTLAGELAAALAGLAAVTDQSDGWTLLALIGAGARDVMARLCPLDVAAEAMPEGTAARTELAHMMALITAIPDGFGIMVMRSFTATAVHHISEAMESVAAQG